MDRKKMSKSRGNLISPAQYFETVGADALRLFHLFIGPPADDMDWTEQADEIIEGCAKFLDRVWRLAVGSESPSGTEPSWRKGPASPADTEIERASHRLIAKVSHDIDAWSFNTAVAACMEFQNELQRYRRAAEGGPRRETYDFAVDVLLLMLAPMVPHLAAETWELRHGPGTRVHMEIWPAFDPAMIREERVTMVVQVDGKVKDRLEVSPDIDEAQAIEAALSSSKVEAELDGAAPSRVVARPPRLVNVVR